MIRGFGKYKIRGFKDMVRSKGIEFAPGPREAVRCIAPGQVLFIGSLPGYDEVIIVNHGQRYYSLYGQMDRIMVSRGQVLEQGQQLGVSTADKPLYFELRKKGVAINPTAFYRLQG